MQLRWIGASTKLLHNKMRVIILFIIFLVIGALIIISNNNLALYKNENTVKFKDLYLEWINQILLNIQKVTGEVIRLDWSPKAS